ncbi:MAG: response regulator [Verrucomicrobia bacterium]|nr:response regulator [Verrucomicrobiota bacterium]
MDFFKRQKKRVLVIDDHAMIVDMICEYLKRSGYDPVSANSAVQGLQQMQRYPCDLVLMDIQLPDQDGIALLEKFRKRHPEAPVIILTGMGMDETLMKAATDHGAAAFLSKGAHINQILETVKQILAKPSESASDKPAAN